MIATVEDLMEYTGRKLDNPESLEIFIETAYSIICNYLGYDLEIRFTSEYVDGFGDNLIQLKHKPINIVYSVSDYETGEILYQAQHSSSQDDYIIDNDFARFKNITFPKRKLVVEYVYGYGLLDFAANVVYGGNPDTNDWEATIFGGNENDFEEGLYDVIYGGGPNDIGVIENIIPSIFKQTLLRLAALLLSEADNNIGITSKSFADSGTRTFINYTNFDKYLQVLSRYRRITI
jgi:hypothetical protein